MIILKSSEEIRRLRRAGKLVADAHALVAEMIRPGVTTAELDEAVEQLIRKAGGIPTFKGYQGFPAR
ncbi:M24 family metallopeptidase [Limnochorda pilosa]|uniref:M24 family metallopeptidase n=1 Tax=Limnochorda pilosa TaxID=1555112 RepID=UPI0026EC30E9|nr:M24 family metallopeptidase [Limnochorda pilosa]